MWIKGRDDERAKLDSAITVSSKRREDASGDTVGAFIIISWNSFNLTFYSFHSTHNAIFLLSQHFPFPFPYFPSLLSLHTQNFSLFLSCWFLPGLVFLTCDLWSPVSLSLSTFIRSVLFHVLIMITPCFSFSVFSILFFRVSVYYYSHSRHILELNMHN